MGKKEQEAIEAQQNPGQQIPVQQVIDMQFKKIGQLVFEMDIMRQQMIALEGENKRLKDEAKK